MRYLFGLLCVCALGMMPLVGCSETAGTGGSGGSGGVGGDGGTGGAGGGDVSSCVDVENFTPCRVGDIFGFCHEGECLSPDCSNLDDGVACVPAPDRCCGVCEDGACTDRVSDCNGFVDWTQCAFMGNDDGVCIEDACVPTDCDGLEDGTECIWMRPTDFFGDGLCEAGECIPLQ